MELTRRKSFISFGIILIICLEINLLEGLRRNCKFPTSWQGSWYQSGLGHIQIGEESMSKKGNCLQHYSDFYIIENMEDNCVRCLLMLERHENIVQYKESYCISTPNMQSVCSLIQVEGVMYTLVKESSTPIKCPFHGNYHLDYRDHTHSYCDGMADSELQTCLNTDVLRFKFKHCSESAVMHDADVQFECIATWKEGSEELLYGRFSGSAIANKRDSYRCFKYDIRGYDIQLSMSADATCRGLITAEVGPIMMKLQKKRTIPQDDCTYPTWLSNKKWIDITGYHIMSVHRQKLTLQVTHSHRAVSQLSCYEISNKGVDYFISGYFLRDQCYKNYNCMHIIEVHKSVLIFYVGVIYPSLISAEQCMHKIPEKSSQHIFIDSELQTTADKCPFQGKYTLLSETNNCLMAIHVGCNEPNIIKVQSLCQNVTNAVMMFECKRYWPEGDTTSVLLSDFENNIMCLNIKEKSKTMRIKRCKVSSQFYPIIRLEDNLLINKKGSCPKDTPTDIPPDNTVQQRHHHRGNNKKHHRHKPKTEIPPDISLNTKEYITTLKTTTEKLIVSKQHTTKSVVKSSDLLVEEEGHVSYSNRQSSDKPSTVVAENIFMASSSNHLSSSWVLRIAAVIFYTWINHMRFLSYS